jgi:hypothetical protein
MPDEITGFFISRPAHRDTKQMGQLHVYRKKENLQKLYKEKQ